MKNLWKVDIYSSISLLGSGSRIQIRIQPGDLNTDPPGSGSATLISERQRNTTMLATHQIADNI